MHLRTRTRVLKDVRATIPHHREPAVARARVSPADRLGGDCCGAGSRMPKWVRIVRWAIPQALDRTWVTKAAGCLSYQSRETPTWAESLVHSSLWAIRESAIARVTHGGPWGTADADLQKVAQ
jgi:hypothetical protein